MLVTATLLLMAHVPQFPAIKILSPNAISASDKIGLFIRSVVDKFFLSLSGIFF